MVWCVAAAVAVTAQTAKLSSGTWIPDSVWKPYLNILATWYHWSNLWQIYSGSSNINAVLFCKFRQRRRYECINVEDSEFPYVYHPSLLCMVTLWMTFNNYANSYPSSQLNLSITFSFSISNQNFLRVPFLVNGARIAAIPPIASFSVYSSIICLNNQFKIRVTHKFVFQSLFVTYYKIKTYCLSIYLIGECAAIFGILCDDIGTPTCETGAYWL